MEIFLSIFDVMKSKVALFFLVLGQLMLFAHSVVPHHHHGGMIVINCHHDHDCGHGDGEEGTCQLQFSLYDVQDDEQDEVAHCFVTSECVHLNTAPEVSSVIAPEMRHIPLPYGPPLQSIRRRGPPSC